MPDVSADLGIAELVAGFRDGSISPVDVTEKYLTRIADHDNDTHAFVTVTADLARAQAASAARDYAAGSPTGPLAGVPVSIKDAFYVSGVPTTLGSALYGQVAKRDSGVVRRLRAAGAVFLGKTNTAEFGQSATSENRLGPDTTNPWNRTRTPGGSSGGAAASVAAGLAPVAVGSDGGGSIRIPASFCGVYGMKPTYGACPDEKGFRGMTDFVCPGPLSRSVADARVVVGTLSGHHFPRRDVPHLRIAYCARPEGRPVSAAVTAAVARVATVLGEAGHDVDAVDLPLDGWNDIFGPLVLEDEHRERGHLLSLHADELSRYERSSLRAAVGLDSVAVDRAEELLPEYRRRVGDLFDGYDILLTPATAVPAFPLGQRPTEIDGHPVGQLWGAFPFAVPFNVAGTPAASVPCGFDDGLPVGAQLVARRGADHLLLDISELVEEAVAFGPGLIGAPAAATSLL
ncbi:amidase [Gordonia sp. HY002]|uniref:amidase n=1 Tax=Gordonia zhenghanii TaxID=2911516 RepID=UPI001EF15061|nr:amidase [Gordonia zhenghanii]MCF8570388.1 amidase [Gordonia zhenghanii]MCF8604618.1 amidase [Gordonia zhenghanii]